MKLRLIALALCCFFTFEPGKSFLAMADQVVAPRAESSCDNTLVFLGSIAPEGWLAGDIEESALIDSKLALVLGPQAVAMLSEFHCRSVATRYFQRGQRLVIARIFQFDSPQGAFGAYTLMRKGASSGVKRGDACSEDDQSVSLWQSKYFIDVHTTSDGDDEAKELVINIAGQLALAVTEHDGIPVLLSRLPQLDRVMGSERLVMGSIAGRSAVALPFIATLALEKSRGAVAADYQFREPSPERLKLLIVDYGDNSQAREAYGRYITAVGEERESEGSENSSLFKLADSYLWCQVRDGQLAIIAGAKKRISSYILARQLL